MLRYALAVVMAMALAIGCSAQPTPAPTAAPTPGLTAEFLAGNISSEEYAERLVDMSAIENCRKEAVPLWASLGNPPLSDFEVTHRDGNMRTVVGYGAGAERVICDMEFRTSPMGWSMSVSPEMPPNHP